jgi:hypothetical protein
MKKMMVVAVVIVFLMAGFGYSYAQQPDMAGPLKSLNLKITYQQHVPSTKPSTLTGSEHLITVPSSLNKAVKGVWKYDPTFFWGIGTKTGIQISWIGPNVNDVTNKYYTSGERILTMVCGGGNSSASNPDPSQPEATNGFIASHPPVSLTAATVTSSFQGVVDCWICPSGFATPPPYLCNDGSSYVSGTMTLKGTFITDTTTGYITHMNIVSATVSAAGFNYYGEDWAVYLNTTSESKQDCLTDANHPYCEAILTGTLSANLTQCASGSTYLTCP